MLKLLAVTIVSLIKTDSIAIFCMFRSSRKFSAYRRRNQIKYHET